MTSYINACDVTLANSNYEIFHSFFDEHLWAPTWKRFLRPWLLPRQATLSEIEKAFWVMFWIKASMV